MRDVPDSANQEDQIREIMAHLGSALGQSDYTDDQIIIGPVRSAHDLALNVLRSRHTSSPSITPASNDEGVYLWRIASVHSDAFGAKRRSARRIWKP